MGKIKWCPIKQYLLKYTNFVGKECDQWLRKACYAYNYYVYSSRGFTPAELMFGRKCCMVYQLATIACSP